MASVGSDRLSLMAVHAHPDDEVFTGGVLAKAAAMGIHTVLVTATRGEEGQIVDPDLDPEEAKPRLASIREEELRRAVEILAVSEHYYLGYRDSGMAGTPENDDPRNFHNADPEEATGRLVRLMRQTRPQVVISYDERGSYGHPDHIAVHRITLAAFDASGDPDRFPDNGSPWTPQKLYYPAFSYSDLLRFEEMLRERGLPPFFQEEEDFDPSSFTVPDELITTRVDVRAFVPQKMESMRVHRSQIKPDDPMLALPEDLAREAWGVETYIRAKSLVPTPQAEDDLFAGISTSSPQT